MDFVRCCAQAYRCPGQLSALHCHSLARLVDHDELPVREGVHNIMSFGLSDRSADGALIYGVVNQAYLLSSLDLFYPFGWTVRLLIPICWIARRPASGGIVAGGE